MNAPTALLHIIFKREFEEWLDAALELDDPVMTLYVIKGISSVRGFKRVIAEQRDHWENDCFPNPPVVAQLAAALVGRVDYETARKAIFDHIDGLLWRSLRWDADKAKRHYYRRGRSNRML